MDYSRLEFSHLHKKAIELFEQGYGYKATSTILGVNPRKLFKNPCSQAELNKIVPFGFSLQRQKMVFFCHQNSIILLC